MTDLPRQQSLGLWHWRVTRPLLVLGASRSGRSTVIASAATAALGAGRGVHLCGFASPTLDASGQAPDEASPMRELLTHPGVGTVVGTEDPRRLARLWGLAASGHLGTDLLCLDNVDALIATIDEVLGPGQGNALLEAVIRTTSAAGTPLLLTAPLVASTARWAGSMGLRLVLGAATGTQAALAGLPRGVVTGGAPGRGVILDGATTTACQIVLRADFPVSASERDGAPAADVVADLRAALDAVENHLKDVARQRDMLADLLGRAREGLTVSPMSPRMVAFFDRMERAAPDERTRAAVRRERDITDLACYRGQMPPEADLLFFEPDEAEDAAALASYGREAAGASHAELEEHADRIVARVERRLSPAQLHHLASQVDTAVVGSFFRLIAGVDPHYARIGPFVEHRFMEAIDRWRRTGAVPFDRP